MYCPKCATPNNDDARFCNGCGANLSFIQQAATEYSAGPQPYNPPNRIQSTPTANAPNGMTKIGIGTSLLLVSIMIFLFAPAGRVWWFWLLLPAFAVFGKGVAERVTAKQGGDLTPDTQAEHISYAQMLVFGAIGAIAGGILGFLLRPAAPLIGQLDFGTVLSRGTNLRGLDQVLVSTAQTSFNYLLAGIILGCLIGVIACYGFSKSRN